VFGESDYVVVGNASLCGEDSARSDGPVSASDVEDGPPSPTGSEVLWEQQGVLGGPSSTSDADTGPSDLALSSPHRLAFPTTT
jgi:hypothetical protein